MSNEEQNLQEQTNPALNIASVSISAFICRNTGVTDSEGNEINEGNLIEDVLNTGKIGQVKYGLYYNCFDGKEVKEFGGHIGFYVDFNDNRTRKDLYYWAKNSKVVMF
jgi:hypothetical protein